MTVPRERQADALIESAAGKYPPITGGDYIAQRIAANFDVFGFELTGDELAKIDALDTGVRGGPDPDIITPESFHRDIPEA